jgi:hypothetical protein
MKKLLLGLICVSLCQISVALPSLPACSIKAAPAIAAVVGGLVIPTSFYIAAGRGPASILDALPAFVGAGVVCLIQHKLGYVPKTLMSKIGMFGGYLLGAGATDAVAQWAQHGQIDPAGALLGGGLATGGSYLAFAAKNYMYKQ